MTAAASGPTGEAQHVRDGEAAAARLTAFANCWDQVIGTRWLMADVEDTRLPAVALPDLRAVLAEREQLAARAAELEAHPALLIHADAEEREADVRAVARIVNHRATHGGLFWAEWTTAHDAPRTRFADRIAELDQRDAADSDATHRPDGED